MDVDPSLEIQNQPINNWKTNTNRERYNNSYYQNNNRSNSGGTDCYIKKGIFENKNELSIYKKYLRFMGIQFLNIITI